MIELKKIKELSLILSGMVLGIAIVYSPTIYAATTSLLGTKVDKVMTVKLNTKKIGDAVVINGTSYLPVRATANAFKAGVVLNSTEINLTSDVDIDPGFSVTPNVPVSDAAEVERLVKVDGEKHKIGLKIKNKKEDILMDEFYIDDAQKRIDVYNNVPLIDGKVRADIQPELDRLNGVISLSKSEMDKHKVELADLESQLAALK